MINKPIKILYVTGFNNNYFVFFEDKYNHKMFLIEFTDFFINIWNYITKNNQLQY